MSLKKADKVIITDIYAAREKDTGIVHAKDLADRIENAVYIKNFEDIRKYIRDNACEGDVVITMGAGNVCDIGPMLTEE